VTQKSKPNDQKKVLKPVSEIRFVQELYYYSLALDILCVTYFLTSITMPDLQTSYIYASDTVNNVSTSFGISSP